MIIPLILIVLGVWVLCFAICLGAELPNQQGRKLLSTSEGEWNFPNLGWLLVGSPVVIFMIIINFLTRPFFDHFFRS